MTVHFFHFSQFPDLQARKGFRILIGPTYKEFAQGKPIDQIDIIESQNVLLLLSGIFRPLHFVNNIDGLVTVHSLPQLNKICTLAKWRGTIFYSVDNTNNNLKIVLVQRKKLIILDWTGFDFVVKRGNKVVLFLPHLLILAGWFNCSRSSQDLRLVWWKFLDYWFGEAGIWSHKYHNWWPKRTLSDRKPSCHNPAREPTPPAKR